MSAVKGQYECATNRLLAARRLFDSVLLVAAVLVGGAHVLRCIIIIRPTRSLTTESVAINYCLAAPQLIALRAATLVVGLDAPAIVSFIYSALAFCTHCCLLACFVVKFLCFFTNILL